MRPIKLLKPIYRKTSFFVLVPLAILTLAGCQFGVLPTAVTQAPDAVSTAVAATLVARLTNTPQAEPATPSPLPPTGTATLLPTQTAAPSATPSAKPTSIPAQTQTSAPSPQAAVLAFKDDFSKEGLWYTDQTDEFGFEYKNGGYLIYNNLLNASIWSVRNQNYEDVILQVEADQTGGPQSGYYGLVCRHVDGDNYYILVIGSDGAYGIGRMKDSELKFLQEGTAQAGVINPAGETNQVSASCTGENLVLSANGHKLLEVQDDTFTDGTVGLVAGTRLEEGVQVLFDNFEIYKP